MSKASFQLKSMTACGHGSHCFAYGNVVVEIQSVNRRFLEVNATVPRLFSRFEMLLRKWIAERVGRGMVTVYVKWSPEGVSPVRVIPNLSLAKEIKAAWEQIAFNLGIEDKIGLALLSQEEDLLLFEENLPEEETFLKALETGVAQALDHLIEMKVREGHALGKDLSARIDALEGMMEVISTLSLNVTEKYRQKLIERLQELFKESPEYEERILREVALFAERMDITEEIIRFKSHLEQFRHLLAKPLVEVTETRGKTFDFLIQELNREINTIGSKASEVAITNYVVKAKGELEKMREQVQNIE